MRKNRYDKTLQKLDKKRDLVVSWLHEVHGIITSPGAKYHEILKIAYEALGKKPKTARGFGSLHSMFSYVVNEGVYKAPRQPSKKEVHGRVTRIYADQVLNFYGSYEWRKLRYRVLKKSGGRCQLCGASSADGRQIHVDHIKPLKKYWHLRMCEDNLQCLCAVCNHGKGNWDETDWREPRLKTLMGEEMA